MIQLFQTIHVHNELLNENEKKEDLPLSRPTSFNDIHIPDELKVANGGDRFVLYDNEDPDHRMIILSSGVAADLFYQLYTIHDCGCGRSLPSVYCSIAGKSQAIYDEMFDVILKNTFGLQQLFTENNDIRHLLRNFGRLALIPEQFVIAEFEKLQADSPDTQWYEIFF
ncbi:unnamed protein product [Rotaria magnacalcarata]|uniref:Uncharacterized protein n=2 Tax=Rotaria magnacalcarata TaxID=392030 RepID=A0A816ZA67_9BILA|nr:unnamed protein product [Rotaria magnacalcarata]